MYGNPARGADPELRGADAPYHGLLARLRQAALGFGTGGDNGEDVSGMERRGEIAEETGEAAGARERDGAWPFAIAHAMAGFQGALGFAIKDRECYNITNTRSPVFAPVGKLAGRAFPRRHLDA